jgi:hypothetical protein
MTLLEATLQSVQSAILGNLVGYAIIFLVLLNLFTWKILNEISKLKEEIKNLKK